MEMHLPVIFMDLHPDDVLTTAPMQDQFLVVAAGSEIPREKSKTMLELPQIRTDSTKVSVGWQQLLCKLARRYDSVSLFSYSRPRRPFRGILPDMIRLL
jgi:hypothetical protein